MEQELLTLPRAHEFTPGFYWVRVTRSLVLCVCFVDRCLSFCTFSFGHCLDFSSLIYGFWLPLWYPQTLLKFIDRKQFHPAIRSPMPMIDYASFMNTRVDQIKSHGSNDCIYFSYIVSRMSVRPFLNFKFYIKNNNMMLKGCLFYLSEIVVLFDIYVLLLSLGRYLCWWTISPRGYLPPSSQCFSTDIIY